MQRLLVANRGEVALRIIRTASDLGLSTVAVYSDDDRAAPHVAAADTAVALHATGPAAYLDVERLIDEATRAGSDFLHPGYGLLSERAELAEASTRAGIRFVGPTAETLRRLGDKREALEMASRCGVSTVQRSGLLDSVDEAEAFMRRIGAPVILKASQGGGGRGLRIVEQPEDLGAAFTACRSEARAAFGSGEVFGERYVRGARHIEVQVVGDSETFIHLGERDCSIQRRRQKVVEIAPAPNFDPHLRDQLCDAALRMSREVALCSLGTFEFLVAPTRDWFFLECNPRLQVEHTVTESVMGLDLVALQLKIAAGRRLTDLGLRSSPAPRGMSMQLRITAEAAATDGRPSPVDGVLTAFEAPTGPGVRMDAAAVVGQGLNPRFDPLLAKLVVWVPEADLESALRRARRALGELRVEGVATNMPQLDAIVRDPALSNWMVSTGWLDERGAGSSSSDVGPPAALRSAPPSPDRALASAQEPVKVVAPMRAEVVSVLVEVGALVAPKTELVILEAMKMHHVVVAPHAGVVEAVFAAPNAVVDPGQELLTLAATGEGADVVPTDPGRALDEIRPDLAELNERRARTLDAARAPAVAKRKARGMRTARENVDDLCDPGSFQEYGQLAVAAQRRVKSLDELVDTTPADGIVAGFGTVNADTFGPEGARCAVLAYDYTVLAGTQGLFGHKKTDRVLELAQAYETPVAFFCEGGGGRPSDTDMQDIVASTLDVHTFATYAAGSGAGVRIGIANGPCFAGNAVLFGSSDITIATRTAYIGMAGPAMVEAGGLGACRVDDIGPTDVQAANGVVDVVADDEAHAVHLTRRLLGYFQGPTRPGLVADQRRLRHAVPEDRKRVYEVRPVIETLFDSDSFIELRRPYGPAMITGLARIEGRPIGVYANDPMFLGGAIDAEAAEKAARFMQLCDAFGLPLVSLCDTPGFMVGPEHERQATVRRASRMLVVAAHLRVPTVMVCLRKGYGLGAQAMAGGSFWSPVFNVSWPTGEFGPMGLEGAVELAFRKQLAAAPTAEARQALFDREVGRLYGVGKALSTASVLEIDAVIDPADTRQAMLRALATFPTRPPPQRRFVDVW